MLGIGEFSKNYAKLLYNGYIAPIIRRIWGSYFTSNEKDFTVRQKTSREQPDAQLLNLLRLGVFLLYVQTLLWS